MQIAIVIAAFVTGAIIGAVICHNVIKHNQDKIDNLKHVLKDLGNELRKVKEDINQIKS